jgi:hypothetical protein
MTQVNCPSCFSLRFKTLGSIGKIPMSPPRFFGFSGLELCLKVGSLGFRGTTNLHRQEEGHLFEWRALQTIKSCQQGPGHSKIHRITAGGSAALGWSKIRVAVLCLQSLVGNAHLIHPICQYERFRNRALSGLSEGPDSLIKRPNFKIIYNFLIKNED